MTNDVELFLGAFLPFIYFLWWSVCSNFCFFLSWMFWEFLNHILQTQVLYQIDMIFKYFFPSLWPKDIVCFYSISYWGFEISSFQPGENKTMTLSLFSFCSEEPEAWGLWAKDLLIFNLKLYNSIGFNINNIKVTMPYFFLKGRVTLISQIRKAKEILVFPASHKDMAENTFICG